MSVSTFDPPEGTRGNKSANGHSVDLTESFFIGDWRIDPAARCAYNESTEVKIDPRNMRVLQLLVERQGQLISQQEIEAAAWGGVVVTQDSVYQSIRQLRQALGDSKPPAPAKYIETIPRQGYRLVAEVRSAACPNAASASVSHESEDVKLRGRIPSVWVAVCVCVSIAALLLIGWAVVGLGGDALFESGDAYDPIEAIQPSPDMDVLALRSIGLIEIERGRPKRALLFLQQALSNQLARTGERNQIVADMLRETANIQFWLGEDAEALSSARRSKSILDQLTAGASPERIVTSTLLAEILMGAGEFAEAEDNVRLAVDLADRYYGVGHPDRSKPLSKLATLRYAQGNLREAERVAREALRLEIEARGASHFRVAYENTQLSAILIDMQRYAEAEREARESLAVLERSGGETHPYVESAQHVLSEALMKLGRLDEAERLLRTELHGLESRAGADWRIGRAASCLAEVLLRREEFAQAERYLTLAESKLRGTKGWPAERELRNLTARRAMSAALHARVKVQKLLSEASR